MAEGFSTAGVDAELAGIRRALPVGRSDSTMALRPFLRRGDAKKPKAGPSRQRANRRMATLSV